MMGEKKKRKGKDGGIWREAEYLRQQSGTQTNNNRLDDIEKEPAWCQAGGQLEMTEAARAC